MKAQILLTKIITCLLIFINTPCIGQDRLILSGIVNQYSRVTDINYSCNSLRVKNPNYFKRGDLVLIYQTQGAEINTSQTHQFGNLTDINSAGFYEYGSVLFTSGEWVFLNSTIKRNYDISGNLQLITVPNAKTITINGIVMAKKWDGETGGLVVLNATEKIELNNNINVDGLGFRGGNKGSFSTSLCTDLSYYSSMNSNSTNGQKGEGISVYIPLRESGRGKNANGGGGGNIHNAGGGGGGNGGKGGNGGEEWTTCSILADATGGIGGISLNPTSQGERVFLGGGGGGGNENDWRGTKGGDGGGIIILNTVDLIVINNSHLSANGNSAATAGLDSGGGGGAGGSVIINASKIEGNLNVRISGGAGGGINDSRFTNNQKWGPGGGGGGGIFTTNVNPSPNITTTRFGGLRGQTPNGNSSHFATNGNNGTTLFGSSFEYLSYYINSNIDTLSKNIIFCSNDSIIEVPINCDSILVTDIFDKKLEFSRTNTSIIINTAIINDSIVFITCFEDNCPVKQVITHLKELNTVTTVDSIFFCQGDTLVINDQVITDPGQYQFEFQLENKCDSIYVANVLEYPTYSIEITKSICYGDTLHFNGEMLTEKGIYISNLNTINGCDSIVTLNLNIFDSPTTYLNDTICENDSLDFYGEKLYKNGTYIHSLTAENSCDSTIILNLTVIPKFELIEKNICAGDTIILEMEKGHLYSWSNGETNNKIVIMPKATENYSVTVTTEKGCEYFREFKVKVLSKNLRSWAKSHMIFDGDSITIYALPSQADQFQWYKDYKLMPMENGNSITVSEAGFYHVEATICGFNTKSGIWKLFVNRRKDNNVPNFSELIEFETNSVYDSAQGETIFTIDTHSDQAINSKFHNPDIIRSSEENSNGSKQNKGLLLYPNPVKDELWLAYSNPMEITQITVINYQGNTFFHNAELVSQSSPIMIQTEQWPTGVYFLQIIESKKMTTYKLIKI
jgi:hypothetical protein